MSESFVNLLSYVVDVNLTLACTRKPNFCSFEILLCLRNKFFLYTCVDKCFGTA